MNKYAAEKIAQEYYALGAQLALTKQADFLRGFHKAQNALLATLGGGLTVGLSAPQIKELLSKSDRLSGSFAKGDHIQNLNKLLGEHKSDLAKMLEDKSGLIFLKHPEIATTGAANEAIAKVTQQLANAGTLSTADQIINAMPGALGIGAGLGVGTGIYKGLGKLDKKLKLY